jgi:type IV secretion system protein VirB10
MSDAGNPVLEITDGGDGVPSVVEAPKKSASWKGLAAIGVALALVIGVGIFILTRTLGEKLTVPKQDPATKATAAAAQAPGAARTFPVEAPAVRAAPQPAAPAQQFPAADLAKDDKPLEVRPDGSIASKSGSAPTRNSSGQAERHPDDGPVLLAMASGGPAAGRGGSAGVSAGSSFGTVNNATIQPAAGSRSEPSAPGAPSQGGYAELQRSLSATQANLTSMLERVVSQTAQGNAAPGSPPPLPPTGAGGGVTAPAAAAASSGPGLFGGQLQSSTTASVQARMLGNRSLTMPRGTAFACALKTKVISAVSGMVGCQVLRNVYSDDGRTVLIERGSHLDGEYRITQVRPGATRIPTIWQRVRTPNGVIVDLESPATGPLGESGLPAHVDNRWMERIGAALLVGFLDDAFKYMIAEANQGENNNTVVLSSTSQQAQRLPEKILDSTINIPPILTQNQGGLVGIYVARDVDFSTVYTLRTVDRP